MSYISNLVHFVWSTDKREPLIRKSWQDDMYAYIGGILSNKKAKMLAAGGLADHVHVLASLPAALSLSEAAGAMKANSSRWIHENAPQCRSFEWQEGYAAFTVSKSVEPSVAAYIQNQGETHRQRQFKEELVELLEKHGIKYEERYLWI
ncbi:MAG: IS200/IS605 family transposase [Pirellulaceae bacterium]